MTSQNVRSEKSQLEKFRLTNRKRAPVTVNQSDPAALALTGSEYKKLLLVTVSSSFLHSTP